MKCPCVLSLALTSVLLFTCQPAFAANGAIKPCDLLTQQQAEKLFGGPLDPAIGMAGICSYFGPHQDDQKGIMVTFFPAGSLGPATNVAAMYKKLLPQDPGSTIAAVSGLGDQANFITSTKDHMIILMVLYHDNIVGVGATASPNPQIKDDLIQTIRQFMQKL
jgi:hypothetical protein